MNKVPDRMYNGENQPTDYDMVRFVGGASSKLWTDIREFLDAHYDFLPETVFYGKKYGWTVRYRKGGKTLCSLFPERNGFVALIILGKKESEKVALILDELSSDIRTLIKDTDQLHDGSWLWIRIPTSGSVDDVKKLLQIKRKPKAV